MTDSLTPPVDYSARLLRLKRRIRDAQQRSVVVLNRELTVLYWQIGRDIVERQKAHGWGAKVIVQLAKDLQAAFPEMKGFSRSNLMSMRTFHEAWPDEAIVQQLVGQLPWGHNLLLLTKLKTRAERQWYATKAIENGWSRNVMWHHISARFLQRSGHAVTNFEQRLPSPDSELAQQTLKDPYLFDFFGVAEEAVERDIESAMAASPSTGCRCPQNWPAICRASSRSRASCRRKPVPTARQGMGRANGHDMSRHPRS